MTTRRQDSGALPVSREDVDRFLASNPTRYALVCRERALQRTADDIAHFCKWPALEASLRHDVAKLTAALKERA